MARAVLRQIIGDECTNEKVRKLMGKISNGFEYWMVGNSGKIIAVDVQDKMLQIVRTKAAKEGLESRRITHKSRPDGI